MNPPALTPEGVKDMHAMLADPAKDPSGDLFHMAAEYLKGAEQFKLVALPILNRPVVTPKVLQKAGLERPANQIGMLRGMCITMFEMPEVRQRFERDGRLEDYDKAIKAANAGHAVFDEVMRKVCRVTGRRFEPTKPHT